MIVAVEESSGVAEESEKYACGIFSCFLGEVQCFRVARKLNGHEEIDA